MLYTCQHAIALYYDDRAAWDKLVESALKEDFSWKESALKYLDLYREVLRENGHPEAAERVENPPLEPKEKKAAVSRPAKMTADNAPAAAGSSAAANSCEEAAPAKSPKAEKQAAAVSAAGEHSKAKAVALPDKKAAKKATAVAKKKAGASSRSTGRSTSRSKNSGSKTKKPANPGE